MISGVLSYWRGVRRSRLRVPLLPTRPLGGNLIPINLSLPPASWAVPIISGMIPEPSVGLALPALQGTREDLFSMVVFGRALVGFYWDEIMGALGSKVLIWFTSSEDVIGSNQNEVSHFRKSPLCSKAQWQCSHDLKGPLLIKKKKAKEDRKMTLPCVFRSCKALCSVSNNIMIRDDTRTQCSVSKLSRASPLHS